MSAPTPVEARLETPEATEAFGRALGRALAPGDAVLLIGALGAGKSSIARAAIAERLAAEARFDEIPSPTYTLVQTYETDVCELWHADLYRLGDPSEIVELGLDAAFETEIVFVEWAEKLGGATPARRLEIRLETPAETGAGRICRAQPFGPGWEAALAALAAIGA